MQAAQLLVSLVLLVATVFAADHTQDERRRGMADLIRFRSWMTEHGKRYAQSEERFSAFTNFNRSFYTIAEMQKKNPLATLKLGKFADGSKRRAPVTIPDAATRRALGAPSLLQRAVPQTLDWRTLGAVTQVKNQGDCGSSTVFADVANIEGVSFVVNKKLVELSEEELIDCDGEGCGGGLFTTPYEWLLKHTHGKIATAASYPFNNGQGTCVLTNLTVGAQISAYHVLASSEDVMRDYVATHGPISVAIDGTSLETYVSGVITDCTFAQVDTGLAIVGYNDASNPPYWIVKNSWGSDWGMSGYAYIAKGSNQCGITSFPVSAVAMKL